MTYGFFVKRRAFVWHSYVLLVPALALSGGQTTAQTCSPSFLADGAFAATDPESAQPLTLPVDLPESFDVVVQFEDEPTVLSLKRHSMRAPGFRVRAYRTDGQTVDVAPPTTATYRGRVVGLPEAMVAADLRPEGLGARVMLDDGSSWTVRPLAGERRASGTARHHVGLVPCPPAAGTEPALAEARTAGGTPERLDRSPSTDGHAGQHQAEIAFDAGHPFYLVNGSSVAATTAAVEALLNEVDVIYARDVLITHTITDIIVRTSPFYDNLGDILQQVTDEWNTNQGAVQRDVAHLVTDTGTLQGQANRGVVCDLPQAYSYSTNGTPVMAHELAHNWDANHCDDWIPCDVMCDACLLFAPKTKQIVESYRDSVGCLDDVGAYADPLPPYAGLDSTFVTREEIASGATLTFDVLANDHDGNFDTLTIDAFDSVSDRGGTISESASELIYTPPPAVFPGSDHFRYTVGDGTGRQTAGDVEVQVEAPGLAAYWKLDENGGPRIFDASGRELDGTAFGVTRTTGVYGKALRLSGLNNPDADIPPLRRRTTEGTITAWVRRTGTQIPFAGLVVVIGDTQTGLTFGAADELRYQWNDDSAATGFDSGLVLPDGQWVLAAVAVEPDRATLYIHDGATLQSAVNVIPHDVQEWNGLILLGVDGRDTAKLFAGDLDDVRIYDHALSASEVEALHDLGGRAFAPEPPDGGGVLPGWRELSWSPGLEALSHDVYFGTDYEAVRDATPASPEYQGNQASTTFSAPPPLQPGVAYAWRVDQVTVSGTVKGDVWLFSPGRLHAHFRLDETAGPTAIDSTGGLDGTYQGGPALNQPSAQPELQSSVLFDGVDDAVEIPALNLNRNEVTFTAWVRRDGAQVPFAGVFITHSASTWAGINFSGGFLQYKWRDEGLSGFEFKSVVIAPDDQWVFVAMVVDPQKIRVYHSNGSILSHVVEHFPTDREEFDGPFYLGRDPGGPWFFRGYIDDVRIYDLALSPAQVAEVFAAGVAAGRVPDGDSVPGAQLQIDKAGADLSLTWSGSCVAADTDYAIYAGSVGNFSSNLPVLCTTAGATSATLTPQPGNRFFVVVPTSSNREGSYGVDGAGQPRPPSSAACLVQYVTACD